MSPKKNKAGKKETLIVGLGASAGGLEPLKMFFESLPEDPGMTFIVIMHLSPEHKSNLAELLQSHTRLNVQQVTGKTELKPNHIYIIPPNKLLAVGDNHLELQEPKKGRHQPEVIDLFFRSLAEAKGPNSVSVILSGTGSDGSNGIKTIKEQGGLVIAQEPGEAQYGDMPQNAIRTGLVDRVLPVGDMINELAGYRKNLDGVRISDDPDALTDGDEEALSDIFNALRAETNHDFSYYKRSTILRRIERRMHVNHSGSLGDYRSVLNENNDEPRELFKDLLISVTNFFRDPEAFEALEDKVIPRLFANKNSEDELRIWVPGCATGEEAYAIAMLLIEYSRNVDDAPSFQIFASDIDDEALQTARVGVYPESITSDISPDRLARFFVKEGYEYQVKKELRNMILFAEHNMLGNPPFSKLDLISCRNLLIYLNRELQAEVFNLFHYALRSEGFLFLGSSDSNLEATDLFTIFDKVHRIYRQSSRAKSHVHLPDFPLQFDKNQYSAFHSWQMSKRTETNFEELHRILVSRQYGPPSVIVNENYDVLHALGDVGQYLKYSGGTPSRNILEMVIPELRQAMRSIIFKLKKADDNFPVTQKAQIKQNGKLQSIDIDVHKIEEDNFPNDLMYIVFKKRVEVKKDMAVKDLNVESATDEEVGIIEELEEELKHTKEQLQITVEDYETSNEELRASNEELQSMNEELQSTTEELETSQEELQSVNEELKTVNQELESKIERLHRTHNDLKNLMETIEIGILFVDREFCVKRFTRAATDIFNIISSDIGRPLEHITHRLDYDGLLDDVKQVLDELEMIKKVVRGRDGGWYLMRMWLYRTTQGQIEGVVISFVDITQLKESELQLQNKARQEEAVAQLGLYALAGKGLDDVIHRSLEVTCEILQPDYCFLMEWNEDNDTMELRDSAGCADDESEIKVDADEKWDAPFAFKQKKSLVITDYNAEEQTRPLPIDKYKEIASGVHVVVECIEKAYGTLSVYTVKQREFTDHDVSYLQVVANLIGEALDRERQEEELKSANKKLQDEIRHSISLQKEILNNSVIERWKLGEYLHDNLGQRLVAKKMLLEDIGDKLKRKEADVSAELNQIKEIIEKDIADVRNLTHEIIPVDIEEGGIEHALQFLLKHMGKIYDVNCTLSGNGTIERIKNKKSATNLYLIVQEAIKNAVLHGEAKNIKIDIHAENGELHLKIEDDGKGLADISTEHHGQGMRIMNHRMELIGGTCSIENIEGESRSGVRVSCTIALDKLTG